MIRRYLLVTCLMGWMAAAALPADAQPAAAQEATAREAAPALPRLLFIGNSFLFGAGSPVQEFRPDSVTDLNGQGTGGVPALVQALLAASGRPAQVSLETFPGVGLDWHLANRREAIRSGHWDVVVMHGYSTLDQAHPGNGALLARSAREMAALLAAGNAAIDIRMMVTWPRADQLYPATGHWHGRTPADMAADVRAAYEQAAASAPPVRGLIPVGDAFVRAMREGVADENPYDGLAAGRVDLWGADHYHASTAGYFLEALVITGALTGDDPRGGEASAGTCAALGLQADLCATLARIAGEELQARGLLSAAAPIVTAPGAATSARP